MKKRSRLLMVGFAMHTNYKATTKHPQFKGTTWVIKRYTFLML